MTPRRMKLNLQLARLEAKAANDRANALVAEHKHVIGMYLLIASSDIHPSYFLHRKGEIDSGPVVGERGSPASGGIASNPAKSSRRC
jgi:hypothetical protein